MVRLHKTTRGIEIIARTTFPVALQGLFYNGDQLVGIDVKGGIRIHGVSSALAATLESKREIECVGKPASSGKVALVERESRGGLRMAVIDLKTGNECQISVEMSNCSGLAYSPRKNLAVLTSGEYEPAIITALDCASKSSRLLNPLRSESGLPTVLSDVALSANGKRAFARSDQRDLVLFDLPSRRLLGVLGMGDTSALGVSRDGTRAISISQGRLVMWNLQPSEWRDLGVSLAGGGKAAGS